MNKTSKQHNSQSFSSNLHRCQLESQYRCATTLAHDYQNENGHPCSFSCYTVRSWTSKKCQKVYTLTPTRHNSCCRVITVYQRELKLPSGHFHSRVQATTKPWNFQRTPGPHSHLPPRNHSNKQINILIRPWDRRWQELNPWLQTLASQCVHGLINLLLPMSSHLESEKLTIPPPTAWTAKNIENSQRNYNYLTVNCN